MCGSLAVMNMPDIKIAARSFAGTGFLPQMVSYAQNFEDVALRRALPDIEQGFWIDIGAYDATMHSVTKHFYDAGWSGVNVEPNPARSEQLSLERPRDAIVRSAIGKTHGMIKLHIIGDTGLTTTVPSFAEMHAKAGYNTTREVDVPLIPLESLFNLHGQSRTIDFFKVDAEGAESDIITPYDFKSCRPRIILVEASPDFSYDGHLKNKGYIPTWFDALNYWYVREEDEWRCDLVARPPSLWDNFIKA